MLANLHLHSRYSDGALWPAELAAAAAESGLEMACLTDHDTLAGTDEFMLAAATRGLSAIPACEIDCSIPEMGYRSELLVYYPSGNRGATEAMLGAVLDARMARIAALVESASRLFGMPELRFEELAERKREGRVGSVRGQSYSTVDLYVYLVAREALAPELPYESFLREYMGSGRITGPRLAKPGVEEIVAAAREDGGVVVLPHPGHQFADDPERVRAEGKRLRTLLAYFARKGAAGVELYWYEGDRAGAINALVAEASQALGLILTYGSDCHGPGSQKHTLGKFAGDFTGFRARN